MLKFILRRVAEAGTDFLFLYFCGTDNDFGSADGFTIGGEKIKRFYIEETCKAQVTVFDACEALVPVYDEGEEDTTAENSVFEKQQIAAARILSDEIFGKMSGSLWLNGCGDGGKPVLSKDGCGVYTTSFLEGLCSSEKMLDFVAADRNGRFLCDVVREETFENA